MDESFIKRNLLLIIAYSIPTIFLIILCILVILYPSKNPENNLSILDPNEKINQDNQSKDDYYEDSKMNNDKDYSYENDRYYESPVPLKNYVGDAIFASCNNYKIDIAYENCVKFIRSMFAVKNNRLIPRGNEDLKYQPKFYYYQVSTKKLEPLSYKDVISNRMVDSLRYSDFVEEIEDVVYGEKIASYGDLILGDDFYFIGYTEK